MRRVVTLVVPVLLLACGGTVTEPAVKSEPSVAALSASSDVSVYRLYCVGPGEFTAYLDCIGQTMQFVGCVMVKDHYVSGIGRQDAGHLNYELWFDPAEFTSVDTGMTWAIQSGMNHRGVLKFAPDGTLLAANEHEVIPLENVETGERATTFMTWHFATTKTGHVRLDSYEFSCTAH